MPESIVVGIDIAKRTFDAALGIGGSIKTFTNEDAGHNALIAELGGQCVELVVTPDHPQCHGQIRKTLGRFASFCLTGKTVAQGGIEMNHSRPSRLFGGFSVPFHVIRLTFCALIQGKKNPGELPPGLNLYQRKTFR